MIIIHGDDSLNSYKRLSDLLERHKVQGVAVIVKDGAELDLATLYQEVGSEDLFGGKSVLVIKSLLSGTKSKQKDGLIQTLTKMTAVEVILYEPRGVSDTTLKPFVKAQIEAFNISPVIFKFLDVLHPDNTRVILQAWNRLLELGHEPEYVFSMVTRQIRLLIQAKSGASYLKLSPYPKKLITAQANFFTLNQLLDLHYRLYETDKRIKTGLSSLPLDQLLLQFFYSL